MHVIPSRKSVVLVTPRQAQQLLLPKGEAAAKLSLEAKVEATFGRT